MPTKIPWASETWNPVTGCSKISAGCDNCYAERMAKRLAGRYGYPENDPFQVTFHEDKLDRPFRWKKPRRIFVCSMSDLFHENVKQDDIMRVLYAAHAASRHTFIFLTKRPERMKYIMGIIRALHLDKIPENWWLGVTTENQKAADARVPILQQIPAAVRFLSVEPMIEPVNLTPWLGEGKASPRITWVICGGETGPGARPMDPSWVRSVRDECIAAEVPFFFKGWGAFRPIRTRESCYQRGAKISPGGQVMLRVGAKNSGRILDGREWNEYPRTGEQGLNHLP